MESFILGSDHAGYLLKEKIAAHLREKGYSVEDIGCPSEASVDYPAISALLAKRMQALEETGLQTSGTVRGLLCCGSGIGVCISANRFPWIRAVEAHDHNTVMLSRRHNDSNVLCLGGRVIAPELAFELIETWMKTPFEGGRHQKRVDMMTTLNVENQGASAAGHPKESRVC
jgi:ribose 5-phosphate isomerase B